MRIFVFLIIYCLTTAIYSEIHFNQRIDFNQKAVWQFTGKTPLPNKSYVLTRILYGNNELRGSRQRVRIKNGKLRYSYGPISTRVMSGEYILEVIQVQQSYKYKPWQTKKQFYIGSFYSERREKKQVDDFLYHTLESINGFTNRLNQYRQLLKKKKITKEKRQEHISHTKSYIKELQLQVIKQRYPRVLAPHYSKSVENLYALTNFLTYLVKTHNQLMVGFYDQKQDKANKDISYYEQRILYLTNKIKKRQPHPTNLNPKNLQQLYLWLENIFYDLTKGFPSTKANNSRWQKVASTLNTELEDMELTLTKYKKSSENAKLLKTYRLIYTKTKQLLVLYTGSINKTEKIEAKTLKQKAKKLEKQLKELKQKIAEYEQAKSPTKHIKPMILALVKLQRQLNKGFSFKEKSFTEPGKNWLKELKQLTLQAKKLRKVNRKLYREAKAALYCLKILNLYYSQYAQDKTDNRGLKQQIQTYQILLQQTIQKLKSYKS